MYPFYLQRQSPRRTRGRLGSGYTLVELLVVLAVIAILAAVIFPVFATVRAKSKEDVCLSNLKQMHLATTLYTQDYDGVYPYAITENLRQHAGLYQGQPFYPYIAALPSVQDALQPYCRARGIFHCPMDTQKQRDALQNTNYATYGLSYAYDVGLGLNGYTDASVPDYNRHELADDVLAGWHTPGTLDMHARRGNVLFLDGHVRGYLFQQQDTEFLNVMLN